MGYPFGAIIAGALANDSLPGALVLSIVACFVGGALAFRLVPTTVPDPSWLDASPAV